MKRPIGYFVHHQGRGHAERAAAIINALPGDRPITLFCARADIFPPLPTNARIVSIPSLFEPSGPTPAGLRNPRTPPTLHCAPLGWRGITEAIATIAKWFADAAPVLFITDVSAELAQFARIASIPCIPVLQHGDRDDPGHMAAYESAVGILAPYASVLEQPGRPGWLTSKIHNAGGLGITSCEIDKLDARQTLGLPMDANIVLVVAGGGGEGTPAPPLTLGARADADSLWVSIGEISHAWHETPPANLQHRGWVDDPARWIAAADRIVSSTGNTTVHMVAAAGRPWIVVPEWRYFAEQLWKARMLANAGAAVLSEHWPASAAAWSRLWNEADALDLSCQAALVDSNAAARTADWIESLIAHCWDQEPHKLEVVLTDIAA